MSGNTGTGYLDRLLTRVRLAGRGGITAQSLGSELHCGARRTTTALIIMEQHGLVAQSRSRCWYALGPAANEFQMLKEIKQQIRTALRSERVDADR